MNVVAGTLKTNKIWCLGQINAKLNSDPPIVFYWLSRFRPLRLAAML